MLKDKRSAVYADDKLSCQTRNLATADEKVEKTDRLELVIQACLDIMQNRQQKKTLS